MSRDWSIRKAVPEDADELTACMESAYAPYQQRMDGFRLPPMDVDYSLEINQFPVWIVECNNLVVGGLVLVYAENHVVLANIAVHADFQGLGIGKGLLDFAEQKSRQKGFQKLRLVTHVLLIDIIAMYQHLGWSEVHRDGFKVQMEKKI